MRSTVVLQVKKIQNELMVEIYFKSLVRAFCNVSIITFIKNTN